MLICSFNSEQRRGSRIEDRGSRIASSVRLSILYLLSSILNPRSSILDPQSSILDPRSSILDPQSSILNPLSSIFGLTVSQSHFAQFTLDALAQLGFIELLGDADRVADGFGRRAAVTDQHDLLAAQQRRPAEFRIIEALLDAAESLSRQDRPGLRQHRLTQLGLEQTHDRLDQTFAGFQNDVAGKAVANDHVDVAGEDVAPFDVPDEIDRGVFQENLRLFGQVVPLDVFLADAHQSDSRGAHAQDRSRIDRTHDRELLQVLRLAFGVGADV